MIGRKIVSTPGTCFGKPRFDGTRIPLSTVQNCWAEGLDDADILVDFPNLTQADLNNARAYLKAKDNKS